MLQNRERLQNVAREMWMKIQLDLPKAHPESLKWLKDRDVSWLYGPYIKPESTGGGNGDYGRRKRPLPSSFRVHLAPIATVIGERKDQIARTYIRDDIAQWGRSRLDVLLEIDDCDRSATRVLRQAHQLAPLEISEGSISTPASISISSSETEESSDEGHQEDGNPHDEFKVPWSHKRHWEPVIFADGSV